MSTNAKQPSLILTADGSPTLFSPQSGEHYHSTHGAIQESQHIYLGLGLQRYLDLHPGLTSIRILEVGFGTGLNALLTQALAEERGIHIHYSTLELYPLQESVYSLLRYAVGHTNDLQQVSLQTLHRSPWNSTVGLSPHFELCKMQLDLRDYTHAMQSVDVIYFDAFSPEAQPELWTQDVFAKMAEASHSGSILTTYCAKGVVRRTLQSVGYVVERLPGPPGKREVLRATRL